MQTISFWDIMMLNVFLLKDKRTDWGWHFVWILFETLYPQMWPSANSQKLSFHSSLCEQTLFFFFLLEARYKKKSENIYKNYAKCMGHDMYTLYTTGRQLLHFNLKWQTSDKIHISILLQDSAAHIDYRCKTKLGNQLF